MSIVRVNGERSVYLRVNKQPGANTVEVVDAVKATLPKQRVVVAGNVRIGMVHDAGPRAGREARLAARFEDCEAVIYGHTHVPQVEHFQHLWILNPGSPTERRSAPVHSMLVLRVRAARITPELVTL